MLDGEPANRQPFGQLRTERRLVEVAGGFGVPEQELAVERGPAPVGPARDVGHDDVRIQQRVACARGAMPERGADEARALHHDRPAAAAPNVARFAFQVAERLGHRGVVRRTDGRTHLGIGDAEEDAHALRCPEGEIEPGDRPVRDELAQRCACGRVPALQQPEHTLLLDPTCQAEQRGAVPDPLAGRLALTRVVVLAAPRDLVEVVAAGARPRGELAEIQHRRPSSRRRGGPGKRVRRDGERSLRSRRRMPCRRTSRRRRLRRCAGRSPSGGRSDLHLSDELCAALVSPRAGSDSGSNGWGSAAWHGKQRLGFGRASAAVPGSWLVQLWSVVCDGSATPLVAAQLPSRPAPSCRRPRPRPRRSPARRRPGSTG